MPQDMGAALDDRELLRAHVAALFTRDGNDRLVRVHEEGGKPAPRFFLGRTPTGNEWWFRHDVPADVISLLDVACRALPIGMETTSPDGISPSLEAILAPVDRIWAGPAFRFETIPAMSSRCVVVTHANVDVLHPHLGDWRGDVGLCRPLWTVVVDGAAVSVCGSVRRGELADADEAGVETAPAFRGKGYAIEAVAAWAAAVRQLGRLPLYSTSWSNTASRAVAAKLGLIQLASDFQVL